MIKLFGSLMIIGSGIGVGFLLSSKNKTHLKTVESIEKMFIQTSLMLKYNAVTFNELIGYLQESSQTNSLNFLKCDNSSLNIPHEIVCNIRKNKDALTQDELNALLDFFSQFGQTDIDGQVLLSKRYESFFNDRVNYLREESKQKCKLYNSLGFLGGAFLAVLLI